MLLILSFIVIFAGMRIKIFNINGFLQQWPYFTKDHLLLLDYLAYPHSLCNTALLAQLGTVLSLNLENSLNMNSNGICAHITWPSAAKHSMLGAGIENAFSDNRQYCTLQLTNGLTPSLDLAMRETGPAAQQKRFVQLGIDST